MCSVDSFDRERGVRELSASSSVSSDQDNEMHGWPMTLFHGSSLYSDSTVFGLLTPSDSATLRPVFFSRDKQLFTDVESTWVIVASFLTGRIKKFIRIYIFGRSSNQQSTFEYQNCGLAGRIRNDGQTSEPVSGFSAA